MNDKRNDTNENTKQMRREQLIEQCLNAGMPVAGDEDEETLEMYLEMVNDDEFDDFGLNEDDSNVNKTNGSSNQVKKNVLGRLVSLFM
jgi:hypothetical protein